ncbi:uncharacterized protein DS421_16g555270 [Arachis hypogaea]|nr:uncharacterized protein DS421_16g555270 [Arachis hypogaea]
MYAMSNFIVVKNTRITQTIPSQWILTFSHRTTVNYIQEPSFPLEAFRFRTIVELLNVDKNHPSDLFDVIAEVVGKEDPRDLVTTKGKETKRLAVVLEDLEHNKIDCILFEKMVDQILPHLEDGTREPMIVSSDAPATSSVRISQISSQSGWTIIDELTQGNVAVKTIEQVIHCEKSCKNYPKKVDTPIGDRYECGRYGHTHESAALRFKVEVMVYNGTGSISLLLWDRKIVQLCGKRAEQIKEQEVDDEYPSTLNNIMDRKLLLKLNEGGCSNSVHVSGNVVNLKNDCDPKYNLDAMDKFISSLKCKTPAKRPSNGLKCGSQSGNEIDEDGQLSINKFSKKRWKQQISTKARKLCILSMFRISVLVLNVLPWNIIPIDYYMNN